MTARRLTRISRPVGQSITIGRMQRISSASNPSSSQPLLNVAATRQIEQLAAADLPPQTLMQRAGLAVARLTLALAPHAQRIWIACGPGNNGGDGFEAALQLHRWGKTVLLSWTGLPAGKTQSPPDAQAARERALAAGLQISQHAPEAFDFCIDALLGIGASLDPRRDSTALMQHWLRLMQQSGAACLAVDLPTGLDADTGASSRNDNDSAKVGHVTTKSIAARARTTVAQSTFTLSLLTLKPGLFTAHGRDLAGEVWFDDLGVKSAASAGLIAPSAWLLGADRAALPPRATAAHASHKGSFGDVAVLGGESAAHSHMTGAALLAARAALHAGAGKVYVALLDAPGEAGSVTVDLLQPELMFRSPDALDLKHQVLVCGCGGGQAVRGVLPKVLSTASRLVLDADALNAIASDSQLQTQLKARNGRGYLTVLTPHPLEAARLLQTSAAAVQADRLGAARQLAEQFQAVVVLKGSGSVIAALGQISCINATGNALLATAGTGDVLAGLIGACMAGGLDAFDAACSAVFEHGRQADNWARSRPGETLSASALAMLVT